MAQLWGWEGGTGKKEHKKQHRILPFPKEKASPDPLAEFSVARRRWSKEEDIFQSIIAN